MPTDFKPSDEAARSGFAAPSLLYADWRGFVHLTPLLHDVNARGQMHYAGLRASEGAANCEAARRRGGTEYLVGDLGSAGQVRVEGGGERGARGLRLPWGSSNWWRSGGVNDHLSLKALAGPVYSLGRDDLLLNTLGRYQCRHAQRPSQMRSDRPLRAVAVGGARRLRHCHFGVTRAAGTSPTESRLGLIRQVLPNLKAGSPRKLIDPPRDDLLELQELETDSRPARISDEERGSSFDFRFCCFFPPLRLAARVAFGFAMTNMPTRGCPGDDPTPEAVPRRR
jgi:hypothetical protein